MTKKKATLANKEEPTRKLWGWRYQGGGFLVGMPARDITADEARQNDLAAILDDSTLYRRDYVEVE